MLAEVAAEVALPLCRRVQALGSLGAILPQVLPAFCARLALAFVIPAQSQQLDSQRVQQCSRCTGPFHKSLTLLPCCVICTGHHQAIPRHPRDLLTWCAGMERPSTASRRSTPLMTPGSAGGMRASAAIRLGTAVAPGTAMRMGTAGGADFGERPMTSNKVGADLIAAGHQCDTVAEEQHQQCICRSLILLASGTVCIPPAIGSQ